MGLAGLLAWAGTGLTRAQEPRLVLEGHSARVEALAFSQDGKILASGSPDLYVRVWDLEAGGLAVFHDPEGDLPAELHVGIPVDAIVFAPDPPADPLRLGARKTMPPRKLAVIGADRSLTLWDISFGRILSRIPAEAKPLVGVSYDSQGRMLAAASWDGQAGSRLWEVGSGTDRAIATAYAPLPRSVSMAPGGRLMAWGDFNGLITIRDVVHHAVVTEIRGHADTVWTTSFSPDGKLLATGGGGGWVRLWNVEDGAARGVALAHSGGVRILAFAPDGKSLATGGVDRTVKIWDLDTFLKSASAGPATVPPAPGPISEQPTN